MTEATIILQNMRGGCATVDNKVHALFRLKGRLPRKAEDKPKTAEPMFLPTRKAGHSKSS